MKKGTYIGFAWYENDKYRSPTYEFEYRGHKYYVTDYRNGYSETMAAQHKYEQIKIDELIAQEIRQKNSNEETFDIDKIWKELGWD